MTTRIFRSTWAVYGGEIHRHRLLARLAEPRRCPFRLPRRAALSDGLLVDCGPGVLSHGCGSETAGRTSTRSRSPTSISTTGATSCRGSGARCTAPAASRSTSDPSSGCTPEDGTCWSSSVSASGSGTCSTGCSRSRSTSPRQPFTAAGFRDRPRPAAALHARDVRLPDLGRRLRRSPTPATAARASRLVDLARDVDLFVCEATLDRGDDDGLPRGHLSVDEALASRLGSRREARSADAPAGRALLPVGMSSAPTTGSRWSSTLSPQARAARVRSGAGSARAPRFVTRRRPSDRRRRFVSLPRPGGDR